MGVPADTVGTDGPRPGRRHRPAAHLSEDREDRTRLRQLGREGVATTTPGGDGGRLDDGGSAVPARRRGGRVPVGASAPAWTAPAVRTATADARTTSIVPAGDLDDRGREVARQRDEVRDADDHREPRPPPPAVSPAGVRRGSGPTRRRAHRQSIIHHAISRGFAKHHARSLPVRTGAPFRGDGPPTVIMSTVAVAESTRDSRRR